jgi:hypothetical protein
MPVAVFMRATQWPNTQLPTTTRNWNVCLIPSGSTDVDNSVFAYGNQLARVKPALIHEPDEIETRILLFESLKKYTSKTTRSLLLWRMEFKSVNSAGRFCWLYFLRLTSAVNRGGFSETSISCYWNTKCKFPKSGIFHIHCCDNSKSLLSP